MHNETYGLWHVIALAVGIAGSSLSLIWNTYESRTLNRRLNDMQIKYASTQLTSRELNLEHSARLSLIHMDRVSREVLGMQAPHLGNTQIIRLEPGR
jgi:cell division protein FtsL